MWSNLKQANPIQHHSYDLPSAWLWLSMGTLSLGCLNKQPRLSFCSRWRLQNTQSNRFTWGATSEIKDIWTSLSRLKSLCSIVVADKMDESDWLWWEENNSHKSMNHLDEVSRGLGGFICTTFSFDHQDLQENLDLLRFTVSSIQAFSCRLILQRMMYAMWYLSLCQLTKRSWRWRWRF